MKNILNFWTKTTANFTKCENPKDVKPFAVSPKGSKYYLLKNETGFSIVRYADHWGAIDGGCYWLLEGDTRDGWEYGECKLSDFIDAVAYEVTASLIDNKLELIIINDRVLKLNETNNEVSGVSTSENLIEDENLLLKYFKRYFNNEFLEAAQFNEHVFKNFKSE